MRCVVNTPEGPVVEEEEHAMERVAKRLKKQQEADQHYAERYARQKMKRQVIQLEVMREKSEQHMSLAKHQIPTGQLTDSNWHQFLLSLTSSEETIVFNPLLKAGDPAFHGTGKDPLGPDWQLDVDARPQIIVNVRIPKEKRGESGAH